MDESEESYEPILPDDLVPTKRASEPPPLQRLWKAPVDTDEVEATEAAKAKKKKEAEEPTPPPKRKAKPKPLFIAKDKKKKAEPVIDDGTGAVKLEETPVLDTYEARQRARWIFGGLITVIVGTGIYLVFGAAGGGSNGPDAAGGGELPDPRQLSTVPSDGEAEARNILENAKNADKLGKIPAAVILLTRLTKAYPNSSAGREGQLALDRHRDNKPLFDPDAPKVVGGPARPPETGPKLTTTTPPPSGTGGTVTGPAPKAAPNLVTEPSKPADVPAPNITVVTPPVAPRVAINTLPSGYRPNYDAPIHPSGWPTRIRADQDGSELVLVPGGTFDMGRVDGESQEGPVHRVTLSTYYIDLHEVTVRQFSLYLKETGRPLDPVKKAAPKGVEPAKADDFPMVNVSAKEAKSFCDWARRTLPTEAQWEMAARSIDGKISFWHGELPRPDPDKGSRTMAPVMSLPSDVSSCGAFDMGANAWEWTADYYDSQYYKQFRNLVVDPPGPKEPRTKIVSMAVRGGSKSGILTWREGQKAETRLPFLGFRGALQVEVTAPPPAIANPANPPPGGNGPAPKGVAQPF